MKSIEWVQNAIADRKKLLRREGLALGTFTSGLNIPVTALQGALALAVYTQYQHVSPKTFHELSLAATAVSIGVSNIFEYYALRREGYSSNLMTQLSYTAFKNEVFSILGANLMTHVINPLLPFKPDGYVTLHMLMSGQTEIFVSNMLARSVVSLATNGPINAALICGQGEKITSALDTFDLLRRPGIPAIDAWSDDPFQRRSKNTI